MPIDLTIQELNLAVTSSNVLHQLEDKLTKMFLEDWLLNQEDFDREREVSCD